MSVESAIRLLDTAKDLKVLFVGDRIVDEYQYVSPLGKCPKEYVIPVKFERREVFEGGVLAAARHAKSFCDNVTIYSRGPITRKVRFVDSTYTRKLSEIHYDDGLHENGMYEREPDVTVVTDFGHGAVTPGVMAQLYDHRGFLAVNAQTNSSNAGFNLITKYKRADYIVIDEPEARLAAGERNGPIENVIMKLASGRCQKMIVTQGARGATGYEEGVGFLRAEALTDKIVDTLGAGDAFFAVTALFAKHGTLEDLLAIGNAAGAAKTQIIGHQRAVTKEDILAGLHAE